MCNHENKQILNIKHHHIIKKSVKTKSVSSKRIFSVFPNQGKPNFREYFIGLKFDNLFASFEKKIIMQLSIFVKNKKLLSH